MSNVIRFSPQVTFNCSTSCTKKIKKGFKKMEILQPSEWPRPKGYSNGISATGKLVVTGGIVGWDNEENFTAKDITGQSKTTFENIMAVLNEAGARPEHIVRMTWYITDRNEYKRSIKEIGAIYREVFGKHFPAMAVIEVSGLMEEEAKIEIEVTAVIPE